MKEFSELQSLKEPDFFGKIDQLTNDEKISIIQNQIISLFNLRRGRVKEMGSDEIHRKLRFTGDGSDNSKPGELIEYFEELFKSNKFTVQTASELADIAYYGLQADANSEDKLEYLVKAFNINDHGIKLDSILLFCIIKYSTRIRHGDKQNYKEIEYEVLGRYLYTHPEITKSWVNNTTKLPTNSEIMRTYSDIFGWD